MGDDGNLVKILDELGNGLPGPVPLVSKLVEGGSEARFGMFDLVIIREQSATFDIIDEPHEGIEAGELMIGLRPKAIHQITVERKPINVVFMFVFHLIVGGFKTVCWGS